jgi:hypothetical protein
MKVVEVEDSIIQTYPSVLSIMHTAEPAGNFVGIRNGVFLGPEFRNRYIDHEDPWKSTKPPKKKKKKESMAFLQNEDFINGLLDNTSHSDSQSNGLPDSTFSSVGQ